ncbi:MAG: diguanylate cyclase [Spirochaetota bacterium]
METSKPRILIVDDSQTNVDFCKKILTKNGYITDSCNSGEEAIEYLEKNSPDLILLDIVMPGIDGFEFCELLKNMPDMADTPVIFLSAMDDEASIIKGFKSGGVDFITKPFRTQEMLARTKTHIDLKKTKEQLMMMATTDVLTGLANRRFFMERLSIEFERIKRYESLYTILMIDLDLFKKINDTFGHNTGDGVLKQIAEILQKELRCTDIIGRIGGEEFAAILPKTELPQSLQIAERLRKAVEHLPLEVNGNKIKVTISLGASQCKIADKVMDDALIRADSALYNAKRTGRNKVCSI